MRRIFTVLLLVIVSGLAMAQTKVDVTFNCNVGVIAAKGSFKVGTDKVYLAGTMNGWSTTATELTRTTSTTDTVYSVKLSLYVDTTYNFKFLAPAGGWESISDRSYKVLAANNVITAFYNNDNKYPSALKDVKVTFKVNMELEIAKSLFDISKDQVNVRGIGGKWDSSPLIMKKALTSNIFSIDTTIQMGPTDTLQYKFAYMHGTVTTWESGDNFKAGIAKTEYDAGALVVPTRYFDNGDKNASDNAFVVNFTVNCKKPVATGGIQFTKGVKTVHILGSQAPLAWPGAGWPDAEITVAKLLYDDGDLANHGDAIKGDSVWSIKLTFPKYSNVRFEYKYGINWGIAGENGGVNDNENSVGGNHILTVPKNATLIKTTDVFGTTGTTQFTGVKKDENAVVSNYALSQNYPNPFNPSTVIRFSIPENGMTTLKVYDMLGKEVATLINSDLKAGAYEQTFNASNLTSGIYFYTIQSGSFTQSKKMMLVK